MFVMNIRRTKNNGIYSDKKISMITLFIEVVSNSCKPSVRYWTCLCDYVIITVHGRLQIAVGNLRTYLYEQTYCSHCSRLAWPLLLLTNGYFITVILYNVWLQRLSSMSLLFMFSSINFLIWDVCSYIHFIIIKLPMQAPKCVGG